MYDVRHVLRKAGLRSTYSGYNYLASAVALVLKDQEFYLKNVTSNLYRVVGEQYGVSNMVILYLTNRPHPNLFRCWLIISRIIPLVNY